MNQLTSIYNSPFIDSHSHTIHSYFLVIDSNGKACLFVYIMSQSYDFIKRLKDGFAIELQLPESSAEGKLVMQVALTIIFEYPFFGW